MRRSWIVWFFCFGSSALAQTSASFEAAVDCIKRFEGRHGERNYPYVGYGHKLLSGERFSADLTEATADSLLRSDLRRKCAMFRRFGKDSLLLGVLAYNTGEYALLGYGKRGKCRLIRKLEAGDRNIREDYLSFRLYRGKVVKSLAERRQREFELLYIVPNTEDDETKPIYKNSGIARVIEDQVRRPCRTPWFGGGRPCFVRSQGQRVYGPIRRSLSE